MFIATIGWRFISRGQAASGKFSVLALPIFTTVVATCCPASGG